MNSLRALYLLAILATAAFALVFTARNDGYDLGYPSGYNQAILDGKIKFECKFQTNCQKDYDRGFKDGTESSNPKSCDLTKRIHHE